MPSPFELGPIVKSCPAMKSHPVVKKENIAWFLPETDTQILSFRRIFEKVESLSLFIRQTRTVRSGIRPINQHPQKASREMPIAKGEDRLFTEG
jgi:hypothetical protein